MFVVMGQIFSHAYLRPVWLKATIVVLPFIAIALDVSSWYFIKLYKPFAAVTMLGGALMAFSFTFMGLVSMYQLWFGKTPPLVMQRAESSGSEVIG
jgi:hypothetical protein